MQKKAYVSDTTQFLRDFLADNPQVREQQKKNRATWWDKPQDLETQRERAAGTVPQPGYAYFPLPSGNKLSKPSKPE